MNEAQSGNGICSVLVILRKKKKISKNAAKSFSYLCEICTSKTSKIWPNQYMNFLRFHFMEDFLKIKKGLELVSRPHFSLIFLKEILFCNVT